MPRWWKERIGTLYHLNRLRLEQWDPERALTEQCAAFNQYHEALLEALRLMHEEATRTVAENDAGTPDATLSKPARTRQTKMAD